VDVVQGAAHAGGDALALSPSPGRGEQALPSSRYDTPERHVSPSPKDRKRGPGGEGMSKEKPPKALHSFGDFGALSGVIPLLTWLVAVRRKVVRILVAAVNKRAHSLLPTSSSIIRPTGFSETSLFFSLQLTASTKRRTPDPALAPRWLRKPYPCLGSTTPVLRGLL